MLATFVLASEADYVYTSKFPPGDYVWSLSKWIGDRKEYSVFIDYTRSNEIKTYIAAALALFVGLQGVFMFGALFKVSISVALG
jgi:hypothetical protein